ncbi:MAG: DEAD/DEAH box helicase, partial [Alphaproteobacteria bacterium]
MNDNKEETTEISINFHDLGLSDNLLKAVSEAGYETPTQIQEKAIPAILMNKDILGCAQTGTGKTASFVLPLLDILEEGRARARMPRCVIIAPTRELAAQVAQNFETYGKYHQLNMALLIGGVAFGEQDQALTRGVDVLIATPGRLIDQIERGKIILGDVQILIIDEADRMLDMGFIPDVEKLIQLMPKNRQTLLFSATMPPEIRKLADRFLTNPREVTVAPPSSASKNIDQGLVMLSDARHKRKTLFKMLDQNEFTNLLIFCNRKRDVETLRQSLRQSGYAAAALHGDMDQYKRLECLNQFKQGEASILVCSDVAARGLDIPSVSHVYNYDVPTHAEDYVHRIGRTGRAGRSGIARTLASPLENKYIEAIEAMLGMKIPLSTGGDASTGGNVV